MKLLIQLLFFAIVSSVVQSDISTTYLVKTKSGLVKGTKEQAVHTNRTYYAYRGIPFAKPPVGALRFEPPKPVNNWNGILDATNEKSICVQSVATTVKTQKIMGSEDCLYLNVYTPVYSSTGSQRKPLAVMVWIHGGGFFEGENSQELYSPDLLISENVVLVAIAYRLNIFGFFSTGDLVAPGNLGLKDQILGLKWVRNNIEAFGGDRNRITIFGESAGGAAVSLLTQTPLTKGLYHRAIMQSGLSHCWWALSTTTSEVAYSTIDLLGLTANSSLEIKQKLKAVDYRELQAVSSLVANRIWGSYPLRGLVHAPVIEPEHSGAVVTQNIFELLTSGDFNLTPLMIGFNSMEAVDFIINDIIKLYLNLNKLASSSLVPSDFNIKNETIREVVGNSIKTRYFGDINSEKFTDEEYIPYFSYICFVINIIEAAQLSSNFTNVYLYQLSHLGNLGNPLRPYNLGVGHAEDLNYLFRRITNPKILTSSDIAVRKRMLRLWTNFAKYGNPTPRSEMLLQNIVWPKMDENLKYLNIDDELSISTNPGGDDYTFWMDLYHHYRESG